MCFFTEDKILELNRIGLDDLLFALKTDSDPTFEKKEMTGNLLESLKIMLNQDVTSTEGLYKSLPQVSGDYIIIRGL